MNQEPRILSQFVLFLIKVYQRTLSLDHGVFSFFHPYGYCRFVPSCSQYCFEAVEKYGIVKGMLKGMGRVIHCHPWSKGGWDPV